MFFTFHQYLIAAFALGHGIKIFSFLCHKGLGVKLYSSVWAWSSSFFFFFLFPTTFFPSLCFLKSSTHLNKPKDYPGLCTCMSLEQSTSFYRLACAPPPWTNLGKQTKTNKNKTKQNKTKQNKTILEKEIPPPFPSTFFVCKKSGTQVHNDYYRYVDFSWLVVCLFVFSPGPFNGHGQSQDETKFCNQNKFFL